MRFSSRQRKTFCRALSYSIFAASLVAASIYLFAKNDASIEAAVIERLGLWHSFLHVIIANIWDEEAFRWLEGQGKRFLAMSAGVSIAPLFFGLMYMRIQGKSLAEWLPPVAPLILDSVLQNPRANVLSALSGSTEFVGRDQELDYLLERTSAANIRTGYFILSGSEGLGKSRLALEWGKCLSASGWDVGQLELSTSAIDIKQEHFRKKTAVIIDDAGSRSDLWPIVYQLLKHPSQKIVVLLVDQFVPSIPVVLEDDAVDCLTDGCLGRLRLDPLSDDDLREIASEVADEVLTIAHGRPLFVMLGNDPQKELSRRAAKKLEMATNDVERETLQMAALVGPVKFKDLERVGVVGSRTLQGLQRIFEGVDREFVQWSAPAIEPAPLRDELIFQSLSKLPLHDIERVIEAACIVDGWALQRRLGSIYTQASAWKSQERMDFVMNAQSILDRRLPELRETLIEELKAEIALSVDTEVDRHARPVVEVRALIAHVRSIAKMRPFDLEIIEMVCNFYGNVVGEISTEDDFGSVANAIFAEIVSFHDRTHGLRYKMVAPALSLVVCRLSDAGYQELAHQVYPEFERIVIDRIDDAEHDTAALGFGMSVAELMNVAVAVEDIELVHKLLDNVTRMMDPKFDGLHILLGNNLTDAVSTACGYFSEQANAKIVLDWYSRVKEYLLRVEKIDDSVKHVVEYSFPIYILNAYACGGDIKSVEYWNSILKERISEEYDVELAWDIKVRIAIIYVKLFGRMNNIPKAEEKVFEVTTNLNDVNFDVYLAPRFSQLRILGLLMEIYEGIDPDEYSGFFRWPSIFWDLYKRLPWRNDIVGYPIGNACGFACHFYARSGDRASVAIWCERLFDYCDNRAPSDVEAVEHVAAALHNVMLRLPPLDLLAHWAGCRSRLANLQRLHPTNDTLRYIGNIAGMQEFNIFSA